MLILVSFFNVTSFKQTPQGNFWKSHGTSRCAFWVLQQGLFFIHPFLASYLSSCCFFPCSSLFLISFQAIIIIIINNFDAHHWLIQYFFLSALGLLMTEFQSSAGVFLHIPQVWVSLFPDSPSSIFCFNQL